MSTDLQPGLSSREEASKRFVRLPHPDLEYTDAVARETAPLYERVKAVIPAIEWPTMAPTIKAINDLKKVRNAVILAHNYQTPEIFHCVADITGDSLQLAIAAGKTDADIIVQCGVHFMAETSKLLNPDKLVLIPDTRAGCSLAASITGEDVRLLRQRYPGVPVVTYVNTSADVKAESDICCTSSNAVEVVESLGVDRVIFLPDQYLANWVAGQTKVKIIAWNGSCEVHERFSGRRATVEYQAKRTRGVEIIAHPRVPARIVHRRGRLHRLDRQDDPLRRRDRRPAKAMLSSPSARWRPTSPPRFRRTLSWSVLATSARTCGGSRCPKILRQPPRPDEDEVRPSIRLQVACARWSGGLSA